MKQKYFLFIICLTLVFNSCENALEEKVYDFIGPEQLGDSPEAVELLLNSVYGVFNEMFMWANLPRMWDMDADYVTGYDWAFGQFGAGNFQETAAHEMWTYPYRMISRANVGIYYIEKMTDTDPVIINDALGQLYFLKAWAYFKMVKDFGPIPIYYKSIIETGDLHKSRDERTEVYAHIMELLQNAQTMMHKNTDSEYVEGRASAGAAAALLAKVYIYIAAAATPSATITVRGGSIHKTSDDVFIPATAYNVNKQGVNEGYESYDPSEYFKKTKDQAKDLIEGKYGVYELFDNWDDIWQQTNRFKKENIFALSSSMKREFANHTADWMSGQWNADGTREDGLWMGPNFHWYSLFDEDVDDRVKIGVLHRWLNDNANSVTPKEGCYYPPTEKWYKKSHTHIENGIEISPVPPFDDGRVYWTNTSNSICFLKKTAYVTDNTQKYTDLIYPFIRLSDIYLVYAEALNELEGPGTYNTGAMEYLNKVRKRSNAYEAGISPSEIWTKESFRSAVIEERAKELAIENGNRREDLIRWGIYLQVMQNSGSKDENGVNKIREPKHLLYAIPPTEIAANDSIPENNPGWN